METLKIVSTILSLILGLINAGKMIAAAIKRH